MYTDLGDNILQYKGGQPDLFNPDDFAKEQGEEEEEEGTRHYDKRAIP